LFGVLEVAVEREDKRFCSIKGTSVIGFEQKGLLLFGLGLFRVENVNLVFHPRYVLVLLLLLLFVRVLHHFVVFRLLFVLHLRFIQRLFFLWNELVSDGSDLIIRDFAKSGEFNTI
jgi:hypothetical protein